ncbi:hypothetical protein WMY93_005399 [Mugilogobius chulae]|uniref:Transmembrane protein 134 n=1 Tax=Mugilogobius chulae TaxID=88201 RepID=A0AAW0PSF3_9GOBI
MLDSSEYSQVIIKYVLQTSALTNHTTISLQTLTLFRTFSSLALLSLPALTEDWNPFKTCAPGHKNFERLASLWQRNSALMTPLCWMYQNLENEETLGSNGNSTFNNFFKINDPSTLSYCSSQWSFSTLSSVTQLSAHCCGWVSHPLIKTNRKVVLASFLLLITGVALIFTGVVIQLNPKAGISSAIFFVPGFLLFIPGVYHVIYISCAVRGRRGFKLFYLPYFEK